MTKTTHLSELEAELKQLVMDTRRGDAGAYETFLRLLAPFLRRGAVAHLKRFGRQDYAEDVTQETLLTVHLKLHTYDSALSFLAWVRIVLRHKIIDYLRRNRIKVASLEDFEFWEPEEKAAQEELASMRDLQAMLDRLKPPAGALIYAMKVEGASVRELADKHRLSEGNVKVIVHRGLQKLASMMRTEEEAA